MNEPHQDGNENRLYALSFDPTDPDFRELLSVIAYRRAKVLERTLESEWDIEAVSGGTVQDHEYDLPLPFSESWKEIPLEDRRPFQVAVDIVFGLLEPEHEGSEETEEGGE